MIKRLLLFLLLLKGGFATAQQSNFGSGFDAPWKVNGIVLDSASQQALVNARVTIRVSTYLELTKIVDDSLMYTCVTDSAGRFSLPPMMVAGGKGDCDFHFEVGKAGYEVPADRWKAKINFEKKAVNATVWLKRTKGVRLIPKDD